MSATEPLSVSDVPMSVPEVQRETTELIRNKLKEKLKDKALHEVATKIAKFVVTNFDSLPVNTQECILTGFLVEAETELEKERAQKEQEARLLQERLRLEQEEERKRLQLLEKTTVLNEITEKVYRQAFKVCKPEVLKDMVGFLTEFEPYELGATNDKDDLRFGLINDVIVPMHLAEIRQCLLFLMEKTTLHDKKLDEHQQALQRSAHVNYVSSIASLSVAPSSRQSSLAPSDGHHSSVSTRHTQPSPRRTNVVVDDDDDAEVVPTISATTFTSVVAPAPAPPPSITTSTTAVPAPPASTTVSSTAPPIDIEGLPHEESTTLPQVEMSFAEQCKRMNERIDEVLQLQNRKKKKKRRSPPLSTYNNKRRQRKRKQKATQQPHVEQTHEDEQDETSFAYDYTHEEQEEEGVNNDNRNQRWTQKHLDKESLCRKVFAEIKAKADKILGKDNKVCISEKVWNTFQPVFMNHETTDTDRTSFFYVGIMSILRYTLRHL